MTLRNLAVAVLAVMLAGGVALATEVTFQVDMSYQQDLGNFDAGFDGVGIRGDMNGWAGADELLDADNDLIYSTTLDLDANQSYNYKFVIWLAGNPDDVVWENNINNRVVDVEMDPIVLDPVWFDNNSPTVTNYEITFRVSMHNVANFDPDNDAVVVRGGRTEIGNWGGYTQLDRLGESLLYVQTIFFDDYDPPATLEYKYVIDYDNDQADPVEWEQLGGPYDNRIIELTGDEPDSDDNGYLEYSQGTAWFSNTFPTAQGTMYGAPYEWPVEFPAEGGTASFEMWLHTTINNPFPGNLWLDVLAPNGNTYTLAALPFVFMPNFSRVFPSLDVEIPGFAPAGTYTVTVKGGIYPNFAPLQASFTGTKLANGITGTAIGFNGGADWDVTPITASDLGVTVTEALPAEFKLEAAYPNPFNPTTSVAVTLPATSELTVAVYNVAGQQVAELAKGQFNAGRQEFVFDARGLASGVYFVQAQVPGELNAMQKITLLK